MADMRQHREFSSGMRAAATSPLVAGGATLSASPSQILTGALMPLRLSGSRLCTMPGAIAKTAFTPGMLRSSLR